MSYAFDDLPPDYAFDYGGVDPWVWRASNGGSWMVEPLASGERYYYYEPGAYLPFFVRDPDYGYAYRNGVLVEVYDSYGRPWTSGYTPWMTERAGSYRDRGRSLYDAAQRSPRRSDFGGAWAARRPRLEAQQRVWAVQQERDEGWRHWRSARPARVERAVWERERVERRARGARVGEPLTYADARQPSRFVANPAYADAARRGRDDTQARFHRERGPQAQARQQAEQRRGWERPQVAEQARRQEVQRRGWEQRQQAQARQQDAQRQGHERRQFAEQARQQEEQRRGWERGRQQEQARQQHENERRGREQQARQQEEQRRGWERGRQQEQARQQHENERRGREQQARQQQDNERRGREQRQQAEARQQQQAQRQPGRQDRGGGERQQVARNDRGDRGHGKGRD